MIMPQTGHGYATSDFQAFPVKSPSSSLESQVLKFEAIATTGSRDTRIRLSETFRNTLDAIPEEMPISTSSPGAYDLLPILILHFASDGRMTAEFPSHGVLPSMKAPTDNTANGKLTLTFFSEPFLTSPMSITSTLPDDGSATATMTLVALAENFSFALPPWQKADSSETGVLVTLSSTTWMPRADSEPSEARSEADRTRPIFDTTASSLSAFFDPWMGVLAMRDLSSAGTSWMDKSPSPTLSHLVLASPSMKLASWSSMVLPYSTREILAFPTNGLPKRSAVRSTSIPSGALRQADTETDNGSSSYRLASKEHEARSIVTT